MIRFITIAALALLTAAVVCVPTGRAELIDGYTYNGWYTYKAGTGLFWYGNQAYSRSLVTNPGYYAYNSYGGYVYYPGSSYYQYTAVYPQQAYSPTPTVSAPAYG